MLVDSPGGRDHVKVLDFGIGKVIEETTTSSSVSTVVGTPHYASPEQLTIGGRIDGRSDIYSLGIILYRMLGGKLPFNSSSMGEVIQMQLTVEPPPLSKLRPETPRAVEHLVNSMLAKDPARRPQNVAEVVALIEQTLPYSEKDAESPDVVRTGETTIQRGHHLIDRTTEEMYVAPPLPVTYSTNVQSASRVKSSVLYSVIIGGALVATGFGIYRVVSDDARSDGGQEKSADLVTPKPSPSTTATRVPTPSASVTRGPTPSATVAEVLAPSPKPAAVMKPTPRITPRPNDRREESQAPPKGTQTDNRQLADQRYEEAHLLYIQGKYQAAIGKCNEALKLNPRHGKALELRRKINKANNILNPR